MPNMDDLTLPPELRFKPSNPESRSCAFNYHQTLWSEQMAHGAKYLASVDTGNKISVPAIFQLGRCLRCGLVSKRTV